MHPTDVYYLQDGHRALEMTVKRAQVMRKRIPYAEAECHRYDGMQERMRHHMNMMDNASKKRFYNLKMVLLTPAVRLRQEGAESRRK